MKDMEELRKRNAMLKDFSELRPGTWYLVKGYGAYTSWIPAKFEFMDDYSLYFMTPHGYRECFPRHRNLVSIRERSSRRELCGEIKFDR